MLPLHRTLVWGAAVCAALTACERAPQATSPAATAPTHQAYIWQYRWNATLRDAIAASGPAVQGWRVLVGEWGANGSMRPIAVDWNTLRASQRPVIPVVRMEGRQLAPSALDAIKALAASLPHGLGAIELDFDSATQGLGAYRSFLTALRQSLPPGTRISITLLPDWLDAPELPALLAAADSSVLQLHGVYGRGRTLFDAPLAQRWVGQMRALGRPFFVALPTYGSRVSLDDNGNLLAVESEMPLQGRAKPAGGSQAAQDTGDTKHTEDTEHRRELFVPPITVAQFLRTLKAPPGGALQGIVWFRLPLDTDQRNWSRATWHAVMHQADVLPLWQPNWQVDWQSTAPGQAQGTLILRNHSSIDTAAPATIRLHSRCALLHSDTYLLDRDGDGTAILARKKPHLTRGHGSFAVGELRCEGAPHGVQVVAD